MRAGFNLSLVATGVTSQTWVKLMSVSGTLNRCPRSVLSFFISKDKPREIGRWRALGGGGLGGRGEVWGEGGMGWREGVGKGLEGGSERL